MALISTTSLVLSPLVTINNNADRAFLASLVPKTTLGATCIGCGLRDALQVNRFVASFSNKNTAI